VPSEVFILKVLRCVFFARFSSIDSKGLRRMSKKGVVERKAKEKEESRAEARSTQRLNAEK
jgi:hypothetical protein